MADQIKQGSFVLAQIGQFDYADCVVRRVLDDGRFEVYDPLSDIEFVTPDPEAPGLRGPWLLSEENLNGTVSYTSGGRQTGQAPQIRETRRELLTRGTRL